MGNLITFWSPYKGKAKVTSSLCAIVGMFGVQFPEWNVAVCDTQQESMELMEKLIPKGYDGEKREWYRKSGISALKVNYRQTMLTSEKIRHSAIPLGMHSLYLYPNMEQGTDELTFQLITEVLKKEFDFVFLDAGNGVQENSLRYLRASDLVVMVLPQEPDCWSLSREQSMPYLEGKKICVLMNGFLKKSRYGRMLCAKLKEWKLVKGRITTMPINTGFFDAMWEGRTLDFFYKNQNVRKKEENYEFILQTKKAARAIKNSLDI